VEVINNDQIVFLPLRFILDNTLLTHDSIQWAKEWCHDLILVKLDFSKAYDGVDWTIMIQSMEKLGMPNSFIKMIRLLLCDASVFVNFNNQATKPLDYIEESVRFAH
jgi:hypothetical protein